MLWRNFGLRCYGGNPLIAKALIYGGKHMSYALFELISVHIRHSRSQVLPSIKLIRRLAKTWRLTLRMSGAASFAASRFTRLLGHRCHVCYRNSPTTVVHLQPISHVQLAYGSSGTFSKRYFFPLIFLHSEQVFPSSTPSTSTVLAPASL